MPKTQAVFSVEGATAEVKNGRFGFFSGSHTAILQFLKNNALSPENIVSIGIDPAGANYYLFYWK